MFKKIFIISCLVFSQAHTAVDYFDPKKTFDVYEREIQNLLDSAASTGDVYHKAIKEKIVDQILASCVAFYLDKDYMRSGLGGMFGDKKVKVSTKEYKGKNNLSTRHYPDLSFFRDQAYEFLTKFASPKILLKFAHNKEATNKYLALCKEFILLFKDSAHYDLEANKDSLMRIIKESLKIGEDIKLAPQDNILYKLALDLNRFNISADHSFLYDGPSVPVPVHSASIVMPEPVIMPSKQPQVSEHPQVPVRVTQEVQKQQPPVAQEPIRSIVPVIPVPAKMPVATKPALPQTPAQKRAAARALVLQQRKAKAAAIAAAKRKKVQPKRTRTVKRVSRRNLPKRISTTTSVQN